MNAAAAAAGSLLAMLTVTSAFGAYRRRRAIAVGDPYPQNVYRGLRWHAHLRVAAVAVILLLLTVIAVADAGPLVDRLFPAADRAARTEIIAAFHEVLALAAIGAALVTCATDVTITFVRPLVLRRMMMSAFTVALAGCAAYGGLFVTALAIN